MKTNKDFCPHCCEIYEAKKSIKVFNMQTFQSHNCKTEKEYNKAKKIYAQKLCKN